MTTRCFGDARARKQQGGSCLEPVAMFVPGSRSFTRPSVPRIDAEFA